MYRSEVLLGRDHTELGDYEIREITQHLAIGISAGRFPKGYPSQEPNEDAVFAATDGITHVLAVADGHHGSWASHAVIEAIARSTEAHIGDGDLTQVLLARVSEVAADREHGSDTALTMLVSRPTSVEVSSFGDTSLLYADPTAATVLPGHAPFLRRGADPEQAQIDIKLGVTWALVTDGITGFVPVESEALHMDGLSESPARYAGRMIAEAFTGGAGDNLAISAFSRARTESEYVVFVRVAPATNWLHDGG